MQAFFGLGKDTLFHWRLCHFVSVSYWETHDSSPVMTFFKSFSSASICWRISWYAFNCWAFCYSVKSLGTILAHTFRMPQVSTKMVQTVSLSIPTSLAMTQIVKRRSLRTNCRIFLMLVSVVEVQGLPDFGSSFTSSLPSTNCSCHSKNSCSRHGRISINIMQHFKVSVAVFPSLTQNLMLILCSIVILQLNSLLQKNSIRSRTAIF